MWERQKPFLRTLKELGFSSKMSNILTLISAAFPCIYARVEARIDWKAYVSVPVIIEALTDENGEVRWHAAWVLSRIRCDAKVAVPALIEALRDEEEEVRRLAAKALLKLDQPL
jgi:hypothetical protein